MNTNEKNNVNKYRNNNNNLLNKIIVKKMILYSLSNIGG